MKRRTVGVADKPFHQMSRRLGHLTKENHSVLVIIMAAHPIRLETPPPSPSFHALKGLPEPEPDVEVTAMYLVPSPQKKPRHYQVQSIKKKTRGTHTEVSSQTQPGQYDWLDTGRATPAVDHDMEGADGYQEYVYAVTSNVAGIYRIEKNIFVVQGWDLNSLNAMVCLSFVPCCNTIKTIPQMNWYHLHLDIIRQEVVIVCLCPQNQRECVHARFLTEYREEYFPETEEDSLTGEHLGEYR